MLEDDESGADPAGVGELADADRAARQAAQSPCPPPTGLWAVAIGASAGGLEALRQLVPQLPLTQAMYAVVAMHLSPHHRSMLAELLARETPARVIEMADRMVPEQGVVYVVPAGAQVGFTEGRFALYPASVAGIPKPSIDNLFQALAKAAGERVVAVVLSGTGSDGSRGVRAVRAAGGYVIAQEPSDARYDSMPMRAIESGAVNRIAPVHEIGQALGELLSRPWPLQLSGLGDRAEDGQIEDVIHAVRSVAGFDLSAYKLSTLQRRLARRMRARACHSVAEYVVLLNGEPQEGQRLIQEMLITVTHFFRDREVFEALDGPLCDMVRTAASEERDLRLWVAGCATGEEAYTYALMLHRILRDTGLAVRVRIFATDLDADALEVARKGVYAASALQDVPEPWRGELLLLEGDLLKVAPALRDMVIFSRHNLLRDPPFLRIDLLSCRNLLIYMQPNWQKWLLQQYQLSLGAQGVLLIGHSESLGASDGFERVGQSGELPLYRALVRDSRIPPRTTPSSWPRADDPPRETRARQKPSSLADLLLAAHTQGVLGPGVVVSEDSQLTYSFGDLSAYLSFSTGGPATLDLAQLCAPRLWLELRALLYRARATPGKATAAWYAIEGQAVPVRLQAVTLERQGVTLVVFDPGASLEALHGPAGAAAHRSAGGAASGASEAEIHALRERVSSTQEHLQTLVSELDAANEELQLLNEELQSSNEELQSTNEELETSNEELQSTNEELVTVNEELQLRTAELAVRNADLDNVKNSLLDPLLVVDEHARVLLHNPAAEALWNFEVDGLPLTLPPLLATLPSHLDMRPVMDAVRSVLLNGSDCYVEFDHGTERTFGLRVQPYLGHRGERCGAVLLFQDVSKAVQFQRRLAAAAASLTASEAFRRATVDALPDQICVLDDAGCITGVNAAWVHNLEQSGAPPPASAQPGANYLEVCQHAARRGDALAQEFLVGLGRVRRRELPIYEQEYPCTNHQGPQWFRATVTPLTSEGQGVVVRHQNITVLHEQRERLMLQARALDSTPNGIVIADAGHPRLPVIYVNRAFEQLTGYRADEAIGRSCSFLQGSDRDQPNLRTLRTALAERRTARVLLRNYRKNGDLFWNELTVSMVTDEAGRITHIVGVQRDVTALLASEEALRTSQRREAQALAFGGIGTLDWNLRDGTLSLSPQQARLFGLAGGPPHISWNELRQRIDPDDLPIIEDALKLCVAGHAAMDIAWRIHDPDGGVRWVQLQGDVERDANGAATHFVGITLDVTSRRAAEERAAFISQHDALTGLPNRILLRDRLYTAIRSATRDRSRLGLMFLDLDHFKEINDSLGHEAGDELLRIVADRLKDSARASDTVCRLGGDEFVVVLPGLHEAEEAGHVAEKFLDKMRKPLSLRGQSIGIGASIGISIFPDDGTDGDSLMRHADAAMYRAKGSGRNTLCFFSHEADARLHRNLNIRGELGRALVDNEFRLHYQPQVDLRDGRLCGFEALLRWQHPQRGLLGPDEFISLLDDPSLIDPIGEWVFAEACRQVVDWRGSLLGGVPVSINVSPLQLRATRFVNTVNAALGSTGARPDEVEIEITEQAIVHHAEASAAAMRDLRQMGIEIALDDFGTGYSSLSHLYQHPISRIKIDQSFCRALPDDPKSAAIVRAMIEMARNMGLGVVAEGVESAAQAAFLLQAGCMVAQGYLLARPAAPAALADVVRSADGRIVVGRV